jgi:N utilization substance protein A
MKIDYKELIKALSGIEDERRISEEVLQDALKEALAKAYKKDMELSDINIEVEINAKDQTIDYYQLYNVVENVEDDELEIELPEARMEKADTYLGDVIRRKGILILGFDIIPNLEQVVQEFRGVVDPISHGVAP